MPASPYISGIRGRIGTDFLLLAAVTALIFDSDGRVLLVRTSDFGIWATLGGAIDPDESPAEAVVREVREEIGIEIEITDLRGAFGGPNYRVTYPHGDEVGYVSIVFGARVRSGVPTPDGEEIVEARWFHPHEISAMADTEIEHLSRCLLIDAEVVPA